MGVVWVLHKLKKKSYGDLVAFSTLDLCTRSCVAYPEDFAVFTLSDLSDPLAMCGHSWHALTQKVKQVCTDPSCLLT